jgi:anti-sigma regulatory factor (Ser/Thr protein kinase)
MRIAPEVRKLGRNILLYAHTDAVQFRARRRGGRVSIKSVCTDNHSGVENIDVVMQDDYNIAGHYGAGLASTNRLMDDSTSTSQSGYWTRAMDMIWSG